MESVEEQGISSRSDRTRRRPPGSLGAAAMPAAVEEVQGKEPARVLSRRRRQSHRGILSVAASKMEGEFISGEGGTLTPGLDYISLSDEPLWEPSRA